MQETSPCQETNPLRKRFEELRAQVHAMKDVPGIELNRRALVEQLNDIGRRLEQWEGIGAHAA